LSAGRRRCQKTILGTHHELSSAVTKYSSLTAIAATWPIDKYVVALLRIIVVAAVVHDDLFSDTHNKSRVVTESPGSSRGYDLGLVITELRRHLI
jgi:hypothetical protein